MIASVELLEDLWRRCYTAEAAEDPEERLRSDEAWKQQRPQHLPATLELMLTASPVDLLYAQPSESSRQPALLLMAGYSPEQLALVIGAHTKAGCRKVVPFTGRGVWNAVQDEVASCLGLLDVSMEVVSAPVEVDPTSPADVFRKLVAWIRNHPQSPCAIECTGGKKPMDSGAAHAASFYGLPAYYLDFDGYDSRLRRPLPWTCRYRQLSLPDETFGLEGRKRILESFRSRRFVEADLLLKALTRDAHGADLLDETDLMDLDSASKLVESASLWMGLHYESIPGHDLHTVFAQASTMEPRAIVEGLLASESFNHLFLYLADEYWRLDLLFDAGDVREALVGLVGLAELAVERIFRESWFSDVRIKSARAIEWLDADGATPLPPLEDWNGTGLPATCLPPSAFSSKVKILRRGCASLDVWAHPSPAGAELRSPPPTFSSPRLQVRIETQGPVPLEGVTNAVWRDFFGDFPQGSWIQNRHALAHLRAPLVAARAVEQAGQARGTFVPRLIEVLRRIHAGESMDWNQISQPEWIRWQSMPPWRKADCAPWTSRVPDLERWLRLRV